MATYLQRVTRRAAGIAVVSSLYIVYTCLHYVAVTAPEDAATGAALLTLVVPLFLVLPLTGWAMARRTAAGPASGPAAAAAVGAARAATLIAIAVWVLSIAFLRF